MNNHTKKFHLWRFIQNFIDPKPLRINFFKINGFIRICDRARYLTLLCSKKHDTIYDRNKNLVSLKGGVAYICLPYFVDIKTDSHDSLPIEKGLTFHNVIIHI